MGYTSLSDLEKGEFASGNTHAVYLVSVEEVEDTHVSCFEFLKCRCFLYFDWCFSAEPVKWCPEAQECVLLCPFPF